MPELPEIETIARILHAQVTGKTIERARVLWPRVIATPSVDQFEREIAGRRILGVMRRGKFLWLRLDPPGHLLVHLRMTGRMLTCGPPDPMAGDDPYNHVVLELDSGAPLRFRDVRRFGRMYLVADEAQVLGGLGLEPLSPEFTAEQLGVILSSRRRQLKPLLLDQRVIAGLGNIYVDESLWEARIHPLRRASCLGADEVARLHAAIGTVLGRAIVNMGTTLRDYRTPEGREGSNGEFLAVYGRKGLPCGRCGQPIVRIVVGQRGTHLCPTCQGAPLD